MIKRIFIAGAATLALTGLAVPVQAKEMSAKAFLKAANTNADNTISKDKLDAYAKKTFARIESDNDKTLDAKELKGRLSAAGMTMADADKDKTVDEAEFIGYADKLFDQANTDGDKSLSEKELKSDAGKKLRMLLH